MKTPHQHPPQCNCGTPPVRKRTFEGWLDATSWLGKPRSMWVIVALIIGCAVNLVLAALL